MGKKSNNGLKTKIQKTRARMLETYYHNPAKRMKLICITGSTGKVAVAHFVHEILKAAEQRVAILAADDAIKTSTLHKFLSDALKAGSTYVIVTAPAATLKANAFYGLPVSVAAITDFVPSGLSDASATDLLDSKKTLFEMKPEIVVLNSDDLAYQDFAKYTGTRDTVTYGSDFTTTVRIDSSKLYKKGTEANFAVPGSHFSCASFLTGQPAVHYMACAVAIATALGFRGPVISEGIANYEPAA